MDQGFIGISGCCGCFDGSTKLHLDRERKKELDAFLLPEDEDTVVVDVPVKSEAVQEENEFLA